MFATTVQLIHLELYLFPKSKTNIQCYMWYNKLFDLNVIISCFKLAHIMCLNLNLL